MRAKLSTTSRIISVLCAIGLLLVLTGPIWQIQLAAPQYPEGLVLKIYPDKLGGDVDVINGLNHYIGMRTLHTKDFIEFVVLPYIIVTLAVFGFLTALVNRRWFLICWVGFIVLFGVISMIDFYRWNYNYGHNLDPTAPIRVPGQSYQPPLIGYKQLLNFGAYSIPDRGGWVFVAVGFLSLLTAAMEFKLFKKFYKWRGNRRTAVVCITGVLFAGCSSGPQPIKAGSDNCDFCKMTISVPRYASELVTEKGKVYKFDDLHCLSSFEKSRATEMANASIYFVDFTSGDFVELSQTHLLKSDLLKSPMGSNTAAFSNRDSLSHYQSQTGGTVVNWADIHKQ